MSKTCARRKPPITLFFPGREMEEYPAGLTSMVSATSRLPAWNISRTSDAVKAVAIYTDAPFTVQMHSGSPMINKLWSNILWGQRSNFIGVPTDCPQRDERLGWTADAQVFWRTASYNMDLASSRRSLPETARDAGRHADVWHLRSGHEYPQSWLRRRLERCRRHHSLDGMAAIGRHAGNRSELGRDGEISGRDPGGQSRLSMADRLRHSFRRWLSPEGPTKEPLVATAYWAYDVTLMQQMAHAQRQDRRGSRSMLTYSQDQDCVCCRVLFTPTVSSTGPIMDRLLSDRSTIPKRRPMAEIPRPDMCSRLR